MSVDTPTIGDRWARADEYDRLRNVNALTPLIRAHDRGIDPLLASGRKSHGSVEAALRSWRETGLRPTGQGELCNDC
jgi:hypothetical protein